MLKQLLNDLTGPEITACAELNLLPSLCYSQDLALLGPGLQDMDQHYIEEQVSHLHKNQTLYHVISQSPFYMLGESGLVNLLNIHYYHNFITILCLFKASRWWVRRWDVRV